MTRALARVVRLLVAVAAACVAPLFAVPSYAQESEPPPEAGAGDWSAETADSLAPGWLETTFTSRGHAGGAPRSGERMRFRSGETSGAFRSGAEPLAGTRLSAPLWCGSLRAGRLAPRWGRGLLLGAGARPWSLQAEDRGDDAPLRGHSGDGATWRSEGGALECVAGRFAKRTLAAAHLRAAATSLALLGGPRDAQASLSAERRDLAAEVAFGSRGRWRAEAQVRRRRGRETTLLRVRGGLAAFRSLAEPARAGPARVLAVNESVAGSARSMNAAGALWTFAAGAAGAAATLEVEQRLVQHGAVAVGFEEQQGTRRESAPGAVPGASNGMRQGWWCEWRGRERGLALNLRHELRGVRAFARQAVRRVLLVNGESELPFGLTLDVRHSAWSALSGEASWIPESDGGLWTLRAAPGAGERTQVVIATPILGGRARAAVEWTTVPTRRTAPGWNLEWTRRTRQ